MANCGNLIYNGIFTSEFNNRVTKSLIRWEVTRISVAIIEKGTIIVKVCLTPFLSASIPHTIKGYSHRNLKIKKPATPKTLYHCGSITKVFTAAAASLLVHDSENYPHVEWDTPASK